METENTGINPTEKPQTKQEPSRFQKAKETLSRHIKRSTILIGTAVIFLSAACSSAEKQSYATSTPVLDNTPGVDLPINSPMPSATAKVEATPTQTPETSTLGYSFETSPGLSEVSADTKRTIEEDKAAISSVIAEFPKIGTFKVVLTESTPTNRIASHWEGNSLFVIRNLYSIEALKFEAAHEVGHRFDIENNLGYLSQFLTAGEIQKLQQLRQQGLSDPVWGIDLSLQGFLDPLKSTVHPDIIESTYSDQQAAAATKIYPYSVLDCGANPNNPNSLQPFRDLLASKDQIQSLANNSQRASYTSVADFLSSESATIDQISRQDPVMVYVINVLRQNVTSLKLENTMWSSQIEQSAWLNGPTVGNFWGGLLNLSDVVLINAFLDNNQSVISLFPQDQIDQIKSKISQRIELVKKEDFAEVTKATVYAKRQTPLSSYFRELDQIAARINQ